MENDYCILRTALISGGTAKGAGLMQFLAMHCLGQQFVYFILASLLVKPSAVRPQTNSEPSPAWFSTPDECHMFVRNTNSWSWQQTTFAQGAIGQWERLIEETSIPPDGHASAGSTSGVLSDRSRLHPIIPDGLHYECREQSHHYCVEGQHRCGLFGNNLTGFKAMCEYTSG